VDDETLKSRLATLLQKSRKAVRVYTSFEKGAYRSSQDQREAAVFTALQLEQWQIVNTDLQRQLMVIIDRPHTRLLASETVGLRDYFYGSWRSYEAELRQKQGELAEAATRGDFIRTAMLGKTCVILRSREQASEAAQHEIQLIVERFKLCAGVSESASSEMPVMQMHVSKTQGDISQPIKEHTQLVKRLIAKGFGREGYTGQQDVSFGPNGIAGSELSSQSLTLTNELIKLGDKPVSGKLPNNDSATHAQADPAQDAPMLSTRPLAKVIQLRRAASI